MSLGDVQSAIDPHEALLIEVARAAGAVEWFDRLVSELEPEDLNRFEQITVGEGTDGEKYELHWPAQNLIALWNAQRDRLEKVASSAVRLGLAERSVRIQEAQAGALFALVIGVLQDPSLNLTAGQLDQARVALASRLRAIEATAVE